MSADIHDDLNETDRPKPSRSASRLAVVQGIYQLGMDAGQSLKGIINEYRAHRLGHEVDGEQYLFADDDFFEDVIKGAWERRTEWRDAISPFLRDGWSLNRLDRLVYAILLAGTYELQARVDVPTKVVINEYLDVAHAFLGQGEVKFVNGLLDQLAKNLRS